MGIQGIMSARLTVFLACAVVGIVSLRQPRTETLTLDNGQDLGRWGEAEFCPHDDSYTAALEVKYHGPTRRDWMGLTGLRLYCQASSGSFDTYVSSDMADHGTWLGMAQCTSPNYLTGVVALVMPNQRGFSDDQGVMDVQMMCSDGKILDGRYPNGVVPKANYTQDDARRAPEPETWGTWANCSPGHAVCGIQTRVERDSSFTDDAGLTNFYLFCCPVAFKQE